MQDIFSRKETKRNQQLGNQTRTTSFCNQNIKLTWNNSAFQVLIGMYLALSCCSILISAIIWKNSSSLVKINKRFVNTNISNEPWAIADNISTVHCTLYLKIKCNDEFNLLVVRCHGSLILILWPKDIAKKIIAN